MTRCHRVLAVVALLSIAVPAHAPAVPNLDNCTAAMIGKQVAEHNLNTCLGQWGGMIPVAECQPYLQQLGAAINQVDLWCNFGS